MMTIPDAIGARYRSPAAQGIAGVAMLVGIVGYMATNALAMGVVINSIFGVGLGWGIWIGMGITLAYSASGGILAGIYNDVFQGTLMAIASVLVFLFVLDFGGGLGEISRTILAADPTFLGPWGKMTPLAALSFFFVFAMGSLGQPQAVHKYYMLRDPLQLKWYPLLKTLGLMLVLLLYFGVGVGVKAFVEGGGMAPLDQPRSGDAEPAAQRHADRAGGAGFLGSRGGDDERRELVHQHRRGDRDARSAGGVRPPPEERAVVGTGGDGPHRRGSRDHGAAIGVDGGVPRDFRVGTVRVDAGSGAGGRLELAGRDAGRGDRLDTDRAGGDTGARDCRLQQGFHFSRRRHRIGRRAGAFVSRFFSRVVAHAKDGGRIHRSGCEAGDGALTAGRIESITPLTTSSRSRL